MTTSALPPHRVLMCPTHHIYGAKFIQYDHSITHLWGILSGPGGIRTRDLFNIYEANADSRSNQAGLVKYILVNDIPVSLVFMILISSMKIED